MIKYVGLTREEARGCCKGPAAMAFAGNFRGVRRISHGRECMSGIFPLVIPRRRLLTFVRTYDMLTGSVLLSG